MGEAKQAAEADDDTAATEYARYLGIEPEEDAEMMWIAKEALTAETTAESVATGTADAIIALQSQEPSTFVPANYSALMAMVAEKSAADGTQVYGGHCETATLCRLLSVSLTWGAWPRQTRATA